MDPPAYPAVAAAAAQIEMFGCPMREIEKRFTKSALALLAWRSMEQAAAMEKRMESGSSGKGSSKTSSHGVPKHLLNESGELDLRKATHKEVMKLFGSRGIRIPVIRPSKR
jgi:hypothetical protein